MINEVSCASEILFQEFQKRKTRNHGYSLRAFARHLNVSPGRLSQYFSGKRSISLSSAERIAEKLGLSPKDQQIFLQLVAKQQTKAKELSPFFISDQEFSCLTNDVFAALSDWQYFAILSMIRLKDFRYDPAWIASRLGISKRLAIQSISRLKRLGLVKEQGNKLVRAHNQLRTSDGIASRALKISHEQNLKQAIDSLHEVDLNLRDITSVTMAIDPKRIPEAKRLIKEFRRRMAGFLEAGEPTEVYNLNVQLVPVTKIKIGSKYDN